MAKTLTILTGNGLQPSGALARRLAIGALAVALTLTQACTTSSMQGSEEEDAAFSDEVPAEDAETDEVAVEEGNAESVAADAGSPPVEEPVADAAAVAEPEQQAATPPAPVVDSRPSQAGASGGVASDEYVVAAGDTLMKIAFKRYGDVFQWKKIAHDNAETLKNPNVLPVGMKLKVEPSTYAETTPEGERYLIKQGDTLATISGTVYGTPRKWKKIWEHNKDLIKNPDRIFSGFYISYLFSDQDRQEKEGFESGAKSGGAPLGSGAAGGAAARNPASSPAPVGK